MTKVGRWLLAVGRGERPTMKLHLGCGPQILPGWMNIDTVDYPGVDRVLDVTQGLPFKNVALIFGEHFIEHLPRISTGCGPRITSR